MNHGISKVQELLSIVFADVERDLNLLDQAVAILKQKSLGLTTEDLYRYRQLIVEIDHQLRPIFNSGKDNDFCKKIFAELAEAEEELGEQPGPPPEEFSPEVIAALENLERLMGIEFWSEEGKGNICDRLKRCSRVFVTHQASISGFSETEET